MGTHYKGSQREKLVLDTWIKYSRAKDTLNTIVRRNMEGQGITITQFGVLEILYHIGPLSVKEIGVKLLMTSSNLVTVIDNLVKQELVTKQPCDHDRRSIIIHLTTKGEATIQTAFRKHLDELLECFAILDETQLQALGAISKELGLNQSKKEKK